jgi:hypothetical protein
MTPEDIIRMAREAGDVETDRRGRETFSYDSYGLERFAALVATAEREKLAHWMRNLGYATGHGDTIEDLLDHLGTQIAEGLEAEVLMEREACAKVCEAAAKKMDDEGEGPTGYIAWVTDCAATIRARGNK